MARWTQTVSAALLTIAVGAQANEPDVASLRSDAFGPSIVSGSAPVCSTVLDDLSKAFRTTVPWGVDLDAEGLDFQGLARIEPETLPSGEPPAPADTPKPRFRAELPHDTNHVLDLKGRSIFLRRVVNPGCGGACDTEMLVVSEQAIGFERHNYSRQDEAFTGTPPADHWTLARAADGAYYALGVVDGRVQLYVIADARRPALECDITLTSGDLRQTDDPETRAAVASLDAFETALEAVRGSEGENCGSMRTLSRLWRATRESLPQVVMRPWGLAEDGDQTDVRRRLDDWALGGAYQHRVWRTAQKQFTETARIVAQFYTARFAWPEAEAAQLATRALEASMGRGFSWDGDFAPTTGPEAEWRRAIVSGHSIAEIRALPTEFLKADGKRGESIMSLAVLHPEALSYLLELGVEPDRANAFGKTPLMTAIHENRADAVEILLSAGADPNATTGWAVDRCTHPLATARMTPLHYAVRYSSADVVRRLIDKGALPFSRTAVRNGSTRPGATPLDWLKRYTASDATERNRNIAAADEPELERLLALPDAAMLAETARKMTLTAESDYAAGKIDAALRGLKGALMADPVNVRARDNLTLVALRAGATGLAMQTAHAVIADAAAPPSSKAAAWFNLGLACDRPGNRRVVFEDAFYCDMTRFAPFLKAWQTAPSDGRKAKLMDWFGDAKRKNCTVAAADGSSERYAFEWGTAGDIGAKDYRTHVYVHHVAAHTVDASAIRWIARGRGDVNPGPEVTPRLVETVPIGDDGAITILVGDQPIAASVTIGNAVCDGTPAG